jgi:hypothetical protein
MLVPQNLTPSALDANPSDIVLDYLTNDRYGGGMPASFVDTIVGGTFALANTYFQNNGILLSPVFKDRKNVLQHLEGLLVVCDSWLVFVQGLFKMIPRQSVASAGSVDTSSYVKGGPGGGRIQMGRQGPRQTYNRVVVHFLQRNNAYTTDTQTAMDDWPAGRGEGRELEVGAESCMSGNLARLLAYRILWTRTYSRITAKIPLGPKDPIYTPTDVVSWSDQFLGIVNKPMRVMGVEDDKMGRILLDCIEENSVIESWTAPGGGAVSTQAIIGKAPQTQLIVAEFVGDTVGGNPSILVWMGSGGQGWTGASLYWSIDGGQTYKKVTGIGLGTVFGFNDARLQATYGIDQVTPLIVRLHSSGSLSSVLEAGWRLGVNKLLIGNEILFFKAVTALAAVNGMPVYQLVGLLRGLERTPINDYPQTAGASNQNTGGAALFNANVVVITPTVSPVGGFVLGYQAPLSIQVPQFLTGKTIFFKAASIDAFGNEQPLSSAATVSLVYQALGGLPLQPSWFHAVSFLGSVVGRVYPAGSSTVQVDPTPSRQLYLTWSYASVNVQEDAELVNNVSAVTDSLFDHYLITVTVGGVVVRSENVVSANPMAESYVYTEAKNVADNGSWQSKVTIGVQSVDRYGNKSPMLQGTFILEPQAQTL